MNSKVVFLFAVLFVAVALFSSADASAYRKPPFNGSIFGKRGNGASAAEIESRGVAFSTLCEAAMEVCSAWMPVTQDSK